MTKVIRQHKQAYIRPATKVMNIETQAMLASSSSIEDLGERKAEIGWGSEENANSSRGTWGNLWD